MHRRDKQGGFAEKSSHITAHQKHYARSSNAEEQEDWQASPTSEVEDQLVPIDQTSFAYQLLLLQQRLVAYEQLHLEEIAELRQEIEQLRRTFLQETNPHQRAISPIRNKV